MADRLAVSTNRYHSYTFERALAGIAGAGYTSVELSSDADLDRVKAQLAAVRYPPAPQGQGRR